MATGSNHSPADWSPFRIEPKFVGRVWGFSDLRPWYDFAADDPVGEVWLTGDECAIATGAHAGMPLGKLFAEAPEALLGSGAPSTGSPLLVKVLFAREKLSVQVHPDDRMAQKYGQPRGKSECWYALDADEGARVAVGLKAGVTLDQVRADIQSVTLEADLNLLPVDPGEMVFVDAGTVHAIWPGSILLEVQQNSDITDRLYVYGRPRELHIEKGLEAIRTGTRAGKVTPIVLADRTILIDVEYFRMERIPVTDRITSEKLAGSENNIASCPGLSYLFSAAGRGRIRSDNTEPVELPARSIVCVPAAVPQFSLENSGGLDLIRIVPRWPKIA